ncbi:MAG: glutathione S-transferase family protein [Luminiphilus sp.]
MPQETPAAPDTLLLRYWNCSARGMLIRYMAYDAALDFVDEVVSLEETFVSGSWASNEKFSAEFSGPLKMLPVVEHKGEIINQTSACAQYVAEIAGFMPEAPADRAKAIMISTHIHEDIQAPMWDSFWGWKDWERDVVGGSAGPSSGLALKVSNLEQILATSTSGFAVGSQISMADFSIFYVVESLTRRMLEVASGPEAIEMLFGDKPAIAQHQKMMRTRPNMARYISSDIWHVYGPYWTGKGTLGDRTHELGLGETELEGFETLASLLLQVSNT